VSSLTSLTEMGGLNPRLSLTNLQLVTAAHKLHIDIMFKTLLPSFRNITKIHLIFSTRHSPSNRQVTLFPHVTTVKLSGSMSLDTVKAILHNPAQVTALSLDTIIPESIHLEILKWVENAHFHRCAGFHFDMALHVIAIVPGPQRGWPRCSPPGRPSSLTLIKHSKRC